MFSNQLISDESLSIIPSFQFEGYTFRVFIYCDGAVQGLCCYVDSPGGQRQQIVEFLPGGSVKDAHPLFAQHMVDRNNVPLLREAQLMMSLKQKPGEDFETWKARLAAYIYVAKDEA